MSQPSVCSVRPSVGVSSHAVQRTSSETPRSRLHAAALVSHSPAVTGNS